jgi:hypothetical protein
MSEIKKYRVFLKKHNIISSKNTQKVKLERGKDRLAFLLWFNLISPANELEALQNFINLRKSANEGFLDLQAPKETN